MLSLYIYFVSAKVAMNGRSIYIGDLEIILK